MSWERRDTLEALGGGDSHNTGAQRDPYDQDEPIQGSPLIGST